MKQNIVIIDYSMGNLYSIKKILERIGADAIISKSINDINNADKIILPGVGHFAVAMCNLKASGIIDTLNTEILIKKKPVLGICLGMQIMANYSEEGNCEGLNWFNAGVVRFTVKNTRKYKVPHTGWNTLFKTKSSSLLKNISESAEYYFVHSYHFSPVFKEDTLTETDYEYRFCSAVEKENIFGVQFHPEKSHDAGETLLKNFVEL